MNLYKRQRMLSLFIQSSFGFVISGVLSPDYIRNVLLSNGLRSEFFLLKAQTKKIREKSDIIWVQKDFTGAGLALFKGGSSFFSVSAFTDLNFFLDLIGEGDNKNRKLDFRTLQTYVAFCKIQNFVCVFNDSFKLYWKRRFFFCVSNVIRDFLVFPFKCIFYVLFVGIKLLIIFFTKIIKAFLFVNLKYAYTQSIVK